MMRHIHCHMLGRDAAVLVADIQPPCEAHVLVAWICRMFMSMTLTEARREERRTCMTHHSCIWLSACG